MLVDDPLLTVREVYRERPLTRVIFDRRLRTPPAARVFSTLGDGPVIILTTRRAPWREPERARRARAGRRHGRCTAGRAGHRGRACASSPSLGVQSLVIEGGAALHAAAWDAESSTTSNSMWRRRRLAPTACRCVDGALFDGRAVRPARRRARARMCSSKDMFTGLIEAVGHVGRSTRPAAGCGFGVRTALAARAAAGESVAVNGVCLTVTGTDGERRCTRTSARNGAGHDARRAAAGQPVNLERAMRADGRFGGHFVQGHVDGIGTVARRARRRATRTG